jgi:hypothetical protein
MGGPEESCPSVQQGTTYTDEHTMPLDDLAKKLETDFNSGLNTEAAKFRLERDGPNALTPPKRTPKWVKFLKIMFGGFAALLWGGAALCFLAVVINYGEDSIIDKDNMMIGIALILVNLLTGIFTYYQENKSDKIMESFASMIPPKALVKLWTHPPPLAGPQGREAGGDQRHRAGGGRHRGDPRRRQDSCRRQVPRPPVSPRWPRHPAGCSRLSR